MTFTREQIDAMLRTNDAAVERAIIRLFTMQNADEQQWGTTNAQNGRGFCSSDARAGTRFARWLQGMDNKNVVRYAKKSLNNPKANGIFGKYCKGGEDVMGRARRIALKHSQQLVDFANAAVEKEQARHQALQNKPSKLKPALTQAQKDEMNRRTREQLGPTWETTREELELILPRGPEPGTWAHTARLMAKDDDSGFDWDAWKDEMKDRHM